MWCGYSYLFLCIGCDVLTAFVKFFHLILALSLLGSVTFCLVSARSHSICVNYRWNVALLWLALLAMITGTLLIHPLHFTFHTLWIKAAYVLFFCFIGCVLAKTFLTMPLWATRGIYFILLLLLLCIIHDVVTKTLLI